MLGGERTPLGCLLLQQISRRGVYGVPHFVEFWTALAPLGRSVPV